MAVSPELQNEEGDWWTRERADLVAPDAAQLAWDKAVAAAPHTEEAGEVYTPDCQGCNDPIAALIADRNEARELAFRRGQQEENTKRFLEHFIVKVEPFYEKKHGKLPPQEGALWELLMFVQHELDAVRQARRETWGAAIKIAHTTENSNELNDGGFFEAGFIAARTKIIDNLLEAAALRAEGEKGEGNVV